MSIKNKILVLIASVVGLGVLFTNTNPDSLAIGFLVVPIVLLFLVGYLLTSLLLSFLRVYKSSNRKQHIVSVIGGLIAVFWVIMQSAGGITFGDILLISVILVLALFYVAKY